MSKNKSPRSHLMTFLALAAAQALLALPAFAQEVHHFDVQAANVPAAVHTIGEQSGVQIFASADTLMGKQLNAVIGDMTTDVAFQRFLAGTGLSAKYVGDRAVALVSASNSGNGAAQDSRSNTSPTSSEKSALSDRVLMAQVDEKPKAKASDKDQQTAKNPEKPTDKVAQLEEVLVTGTYIRGEPPVGAPIRTLDRTEIEKSGYTTVQELLQSLPQNFRGGAGGASEDNYFQGGFNAGYNNTAGSGVNLRGLGNTATLVLVNGHRVASSNSGFFTDISTIPISAIDHIDILTDGASAIYGSDAIAGVVNIVLKNNSQGLETGARYDIASGGFATYGGNVQIGDKWGKGGFTLGADFTHTNALDASDRPFTATVGDPTTIIPPYKQLALTTSAQQHVNDRFEVHADAQYTNKTLSRVDARTSADPYQAADTTLNRWNAAGGGSIAITSSWIVSFDVSGGQERDHVLSKNVFLSAPATPISDVRTTTHLSDQTLGVTGDAFSLPGGAVKLAIGAAHRTESFTLIGDYFQLSSPLQSLDAQRSIKSGYAEIHVPVVGESNRLPGFDKLTISVAGRRDDYSDFGATSNAKYGVSWFPVASVQVRGAYSTSFRAPATGSELVTSEQGTQAIILWNFPGPGGNGRVPVVELVGGAPNLQPEKATNLTLGVDWNPVFAPNLALALNYYDIDYKAQLANPPFSVDPINTPGLAPVVTFYPSNAPLTALVQAAQANGAFFVDLTGGAFGPTPLAAGQYLYDERTRNLRTTKTAGYDFTARYHLAMGTERFDMRLDAARINRFDSAITSTSPEIAQVNTVGYPARTRLSGSVNWGHGLLDASMAANYVSGYPDTSAPTPREVSPYTTINVAARYSLPSRIKLSAAVINLFNRLPPYVYSGSPGFPNSHYDPANANPVGRTLAITVSKTW